MIFHNVVQLIFLVVGITALSASLFNWEWFFTADNARFVVKKAGRRNARWIYGTIGTAFIAAAIFFYCKIEAIQ
ncbi:MAG: immunity 17 family protein [Bacteroidaceae bacterium]|nr:immunity 17 family protein [Bacteroidaceae bacterium]